MLGLGHRPDTPVQEEGFLRFLVTLHGLCSKHRISERRQQVVSRQLPQHTETREMDGKDSTLLLAHTQG